MKILRFVIIGVVLLLALPTVAHAGLMGTYYNMSVFHPDMEAPVTGIQTGWVESTLTGAMPTLTALGNTYVNQWDWWSDSYNSFSREDSEADLANSFYDMWFPVNEGLMGDPYYFSVHWKGCFYVDADDTYTYRMGSDNDAWLFIDDQLTTDLGGIHKLRTLDYDVTLSQGWHSIDIFFADRHLVRSGIQFEFFTDLEASCPAGQVPEPVSLILLGGGIIGLGILRRRTKH